MIASFNRIQNIAPDFNLVRETMSLSAFLEVSDTRVRLADRRWQEFVLPPTPGSSQSGLPSTPSHTPHGNMMSDAAYSLASSLSGLTLTGDDAATIQAKVTEAVLATKSTMRESAETYSTATTSGEGSAFGERDESASNTTAGSLGTGPTPAATSAPTSPGSLSDTQKLPVV